MMRWNRSDYARLSQAVRQFNKKIQELERDERYVLPQKANYQFLKENIISRAELTKTINDLKKFNPQKIYVTYKEKYNLLLPKWRPLSISVLKEQSLVKLRNQIIPDELIYKVPTMGNADRQMVLGEIESIMRYEQKTEKEKQEKKKRMKSLADSRWKIKLDIQFKKNYLKSLQKNFSHLDGYDELIKLINKINPNDLYKRLDSDPKYSHAKNIPEHYRGKAQSVFNDILEAFDELFDAPELQEFEMY